MSDTGRPRTSDLLGPDPLELAKTYPYAIPGHSYVLGPEDARPLQKGEHPDLAGRVPVLACGSNQSPEQLRRKFDGAMLRAAPIPVVRGWLEDFDTVYSAHLTNYGSVPATPHHVPGTTVAMFVTFLTRPQLLRMHETESVGTNYAFGRFSGVTMHLETGATLDEVHAYVSLRGCLVHDGKPVALSAIPAKNRSLTAMSQDEVLRLAQAHLAPSLDLDGFILENIAEASLRSHRVEALTATAAQPLLSPGFTRLSSEERT